LLLLSGGFGVDEVSCGEEDDGSLLGVEEAIDDDLFEVALV
jgi:hypothetical protein